MQFIYENNFIHYSRPELSPERLSEKTDYLFVEQPSDDFYCPVVMDLLLQPHLTLCCGNHLSPEAALRLQREEKPCPFCVLPKWSTVLDKHFRRQVKSLRVYCNSKEKGCKWQGYMFDLEHHSCSFADDQVII